MGMTIKTNTSAGDSANFLADSLLKQLNVNKKVLFFVTGGSSIAVALKVAEILKGQSFPNLTVMLTDERFGVLNHTDSNWQQLIQKGFEISGAKIIPVLNNTDKENTIKIFNENLEREFDSAQYKIGLFGVGADGHTAGILPYSVAVSCHDLACGYETQLFSRITITFETIEKLDEAVVFMQGENKKEVLKNLREDSIDIKKQPAQILKKVPLLTIFNDM
jgi:6-phosphogluconolactonase/glucosamine-6-phosphate isomerase/deaminase